MMGLSVLRFQGNCIVCRRHGLTFALTTEVKAEAASFPRFSNTSDWIHSARGSRYYQSNSAEGETLHPRLHESGFLNNVCVMYALSEARKPGIEKC